MQWCAKRASAITVVDPFVGGGGQMPQRVNFNAKRF